MKNFIIKKNKILKKFNTNSYPRTMKKYSANNTNTQINVKGWRTGTNNGLVYVIYNQDTVHCTVEAANVGFGRSFAALTGQNIGSAPKPKKFVLSPVYNNNNVLFAVGSDGLIYRRSMTGSDVTGTGQASFTWHY